jgi:hypothetical protein
MLVKHVQRFNSFDSVAHCFRSTEGVNVYGLFTDAVSSSGFVSSSSRIVTE